MDKSISAITVGRPSSFRELHREGNYAVFVITPGAGQPDRYMIGRLPLKVKGSFSRPAQSSLSARRLARSKP
jgi:hypothetical protein